MSMEKTIRQALMDEVHYPLSQGFVENKLCARGLDPDAILKADPVGDGQFGFDLLQSKSFVGAVADCLFSLIEAPSFSEADKSISLGDKDLILKKANSLYNSIGEPSKALGEKPMVYFGRRARCQ